MTGAPNPHGTPGCSRHLTGLHVAARLSPMVSSSVTWERPPRATKLVLWSMRCWPEATPRAGSHHEVMETRCPPRRPRPVLLTGVLCNIRVEFVRADASSCAHLPHTSGLRPRPRRRGGSCLPPAMHKTPDSGCDKERLSSGASLWSLHSRQEVLGPAFQSFLLTRDWRRGSHAKWNDRPGQPRGGVTGLRGGSRPGRLRGSRGCWASLSLLGHSSGHGAASGAGVRAQVEHRRQRLSAERAAAWGRSGSALSHPTQGLRQRCGGGRLPGSLWAGWSRSGLRCLVRTRRPRPWRPRVPVPAASGQGTCPCVQPSPGTRPSGWRGDLAGSSWHLTQRQDAAAHGTGPDRCAPCRL